MLVRGRLLVRGECLLIDNPDLRNRWLPVWPAGTSFHPEGGGAVKDEEGNVVVRVGEVVTGGGGEVPRWYAEELAGEPLPADCGEPVDPLLVGELRRNP